MGNPLKFCSYSIQGNLLYVKLKSKILIKFLLLFSGTTFWANAGRFWLIVPCFITTAETQLKIEGKISCIWFFHLYVYTVDCHPQWQCLAMLPIVVRANVFQSATFGPQRLGWFGYCIQFPHDSRWATFVWLLYCICLAEDCKLVLI